MTRSEKVARRAQRERLEKIIAAVQDERVRFNVAIQNGAKATIYTAFGPYDVRYVTSDHWYACGPNALSGRSFCGCNDGTWSGLLKQAGVERNPMAEGRKA